MNEPLISVVLPTYNRAEQVKQAVLSVLAQTEKALEVIVVDDGSADGTQAALQEIQDARLRYVWQERAGACAARNRGVSLARGAYVAFQDSDDRWRRDKLSVQLRCLRETGADVVFCPLARQEEDGGVSLFPAHLQAGFVRPEDSLLGVGTQTLLGRREAFLQFPFDPDMPRLQEFEMLCRLRRQYSLYFQNQPLVDYAPGGDSISADAEKLTAAIRILREKHPTLFSGPTAEKEALSGRLRLDARNLCLSGKGGWRDCLRLAAELDDAKAKRQLSLAKMGLYAPYIRLRAAAKRQKENNSIPWRITAFPVRAARKIRQTLTALFQAEQIRCYQRKKSVFGPRLARQWAIAAAADMLTGFHTHFYHKAIRRFLDEELQEAARALPEPKREDGPLPVWSLWWDGEENAPPCVKISLQSQRKYFAGPEYDYHLLTKENYRQYVQLGPAVLARFEQGEMSLTHLSDVLRCALLCRHGGLWLDATVYMTGPLDRAALGLDFYTVRKTTYPENRRALIPAGRWACYVLRCRPGDPLMTFLTAAYAIYWRKYADVTDYFLLDEMIDAAYRLVPPVKQIIDSVPVNNERIFDLYNMRNEAYTPDRVEQILQSNHLHKLSYKDTYLDCRPDGRMTVWKWLREEARREV